MKINTPLARKLTLLFFSIFFGWEAYKEIQFQLQFARLEDPTGNYMGHLNLHGTIQKERALRRLESLLRHPYANVRWRAGINIQRLGYQPKTESDWFHYAIATRQHHLVPLQWEDVVRLYLSSPELSQDDPVLPSLEVSQWVDPRVHELFRSIAMERLQGIGAFGSMGEAEQERESDYLVYVLNSLGFMRSARDIPIFREFIRHPSAAVRLEAFDWLVHAKDYEIIPLLILEREVEYPDRATRSRLEWMLARAMDKMPDDQWLPLILKTIKTDGEEGRLLGGGIRTRLDHPEVIREITELHESNPESWIIHHVFKSARLRDSSQRDEGIADAYRYDPVVVDIMEETRPVFPERRVQRAARTSPPPILSPGAEEIPLSEIEAQIEELKAEIVQAMRNAAPGERHLGDFQARIETLAGKTDHPDMLPVVIAGRRFGYSNFAELLGFDYLGRVQHPHAYFPICRHLNSRRFFIPQTYNGLTALQDSRAIPELVFHLPNQITFRPAMRLLDTLGWTPTTEEEIAFQVLYHRSPESLESHRDVVHRFLQSQLDSSELRRRVFATRAIIDMELADLFPSLVRMLEERKDGRIALLMHQSEHVVLQAAAEAWLANAPAGTRVSMPHIL